MSKRRYYLEDPYSDTDLSDENHQEIDYPDESASERSYSGDDGTRRDWNSEGEEEEDEEENHTGEVEYAGEREDAETSGNPARQATCCLCLETQPVHRHRMDEWEYIRPSIRGTLFNPCQRHAICIPCIRKALLTDPRSILRDGHGHFPCLGDTACTNSLQQRTTTYIFQLRELFQETEWQTIMQVAASLRQVQQVSLPHPFMVPLTEQSRLQPQQCVDRMVYLLDQDHPRVQCPICLVTIEKTTACFALRHCDWEMCWMCGRIERRLHPEHWQTCPRYDSHPCGSNRAIVAGKATVTRTSPPANRPTTGWPPGHATCGELPVRGLFHSYAPALQAQVRQQLQTCPDRYRAFEDLLLHSERVTLSVPKT